MLSDNRISFAKTINAICLILIGIYSVYGNMTASIYKLILPDNIQIFFAAAFLVVAAARLFIFKLYREYCFWMAVFFCACCMAVYYTAGYAFILVLGSMMLAIVNIQDVAVYRVVVVAQVLSLLTMVIGVQTGVIEDLIYINTTDGLRHSFGINYPTDFATHIIFILMIAYVLFSQISNGYFIALVIPAFWISYNYCSAKCSTIILLLLIILIIVECAYGKLQKFRVVRVVDSMVGWGKILAMPVMSIVSLIFTWQYNEQEWLQKVNTLLTNRLVIGSQILQERGLSLFGQCFDMLGGGGSIGYKSGYYFIDNAYLLIAIRYGVILLVLVNVFYVFSVFQAKKKMNRRLMNVFLLIAVQAVVEHHMIEVWLNIFLISAVLNMSMEGAVSASGEKKRLSVTRWEMLKYAGITMSVIGIGIFMYWVMQAYFTTARTFNKMIGLDEATNHDLFIILCMCGIILFVVATWALGRLVFDIWKYRKLNKGYICIFFVVACLFMVSYVSMNIRINKSTPKYDAAMLEEKDIIQKLIQTEEFEGKIYVSDAPAIYRHFFGNVQRTLFTPEVLDFQKDIVFIVPNKIENRVLLYEGYQYAKISDMHGIYTNSEIVIRILQENGYQVEDYFYYQRHITTEDIVKNNPDIIVDTDGKVIVRPWLPLTSGPYDSLYQGNYGVNMDMDFYNYEKTEDVIAEVYMVSGSDVTWIQLDITKHDLDENGKFDYTTFVNLWIDIDDMEIKIFPKGETQIKINDLSYQRVIVDE